MRVPQGHQQSHQRTAQHLERGVAQQLLQLDFAHRVTFVHVLDHPVQDLQSAMDVFSLHQAVHSLLVPVRNREKQITTILSSDREMICGLCQQMRHVTAAEIWLVTVFILLLPAASPRYSILRPHITKRRR